MDVSGNHVLMAFADCIINGKSVVAICLNHQGDRLRRAQLMDAPGLFSQMVCVMLIMLGKDAGKTYLLKYGKEK
jgi:hypothetical protein